MTKTYFILLDLIFGSVTEMEKEGRLRILLFSPETIIYFAFIWRKLQYTLKPVFYEIHL